MVATATSFGTTGFAIDGVFAKSADVAERGAAEISKFVDKFRNTSLINFELGGVKVEAVQKNAYDFVNGMIRDVHAKVCGIKAAEAVGPEIARLGKMTDDGLSECSTKAAPAVIVASSVSAGKGLGSA